MPNLRDLIDSYTYNSLAQMMRARFPASPEEIARRQHERTLKTLLTDMYSSLPSGAAPEDLAQRTREHQRYSGYGAAPTIVGPEPLWPRIQRGLGEISDITRSFIDPVDPESGLPNIDLGAGGAFWRPGMKLKDIPRITVPVADLRLTKEDVARYLEGQVQKYMGAVPPDASSGAKMRRMLHLGRQELGDILSYGPQQSGVNWYSEDTALSDALMLRAFPGLQDPVQQDLQKLFSSALANNTEPVDEAFWGARLWEDYLNAGRRVPLTQPAGPHWPSQGAYPQMVKLQRLLDDKGEAGLVDFVNRQQVGADIKIYRPSAKDIRLGDEYLGATVLGPKLGRYYGDLKGIDHPGSTVDRWDIRKAQRQFGWMFDNSGKLIEAPKPESMRDMFMEVHSRLGDEFGLEARQAQSGQWHFEKRLWEMLGYSAPPSGRSDGVRRYLKFRGLE